MAAERARRSTLPLPRVLWLAGRNIRRNLWRSVLSLGAIAIGVAGLVVSGGFVADVIYQLGEALIHSQSGHIQIARAGYFDAGSRSPGKYLVGAEQAQRLDLAKDPNVSVVARRIGFSGLLGNGRSSYPILGEGIEAGPEAKLGTSVMMQAGRPLAPSDRYGALVGAGVARAMDLKPGSVINIVAPTVDEAMNTVDLEVVGIFQSFSKDYDDRVVRLPLAAAQELLDTKGVNSLVLLLDATRHTGAAAQRIASGASRDSLEVKTWETLNDFYWKTVALYDRQFGVLRLIVFLTVVAAVMGAINVAVLERTGEFGTMRALGNTSRDVLQLVLLEGLLMGCVGAILGVLLGLGAAWLINSVGIPMPPPPGSDLAFDAYIRLSPGLVLSALAIGVLSTLAASVLPARRVARFPVVDALRRLV